MLLLGGSTVEKNSRTFSVEFRCEEIRVVRPPLDTSNNVSRNRALPKDGAQLRDLFQKLGDNGGLGRLVWMLS